MTAGSFRDNFIKDLSIIITLDNAVDIENKIVFDQRSFTEFVYNNSINTAPHGYFRITDMNSESLNSRAGKYGTFFFTNTTDGRKGSFSRIDFFIEEMIHEEVVGSNSKYYVKWKLGRKSLAKNTTVAHNGTSVEVMKQIMRDRELVEGIDFIPYPDSLANSFTDNMTWRFIQDNMWEQLKEVVMNSYIANDYVFWAWNEVTGQYKISSLNNEKSEDNKYILSESDYALGTTNSAKLLSEKRDVTLWKYDRSQKINNLGVHYGNLFPNIFFSGILGTELEATGFRKSSFIEVLRSQNDDKINEVLMNEFGVEDVSSEELVTYGDLVIKRHWPNNVHSMYSFAETYRNYKLSTYAKRMVVTIYNNVGPELGAKVTVLKAKDNYRNAGVVQFDKMFSDDYLVMEKVISYDSRVESLEGKSASANFVTRITLISDNFSNDTSKSEENVEQSKAKEFVDG